MIHGVANRRDAAVCVLNLFDWMFPEKGLQGDDSLDRPDQE